jgi:argininosuccinate lyase
MPSSVLRLRRGRLLPRPSSLRRSASSKRCSPAGAELQETQEPLIDAADTLVLSLEAMRETVSGPRLAPAAERAPVASLSLSTDIAEALVGRGVPFCSAHERLSRWTRLATETRADLREIAAVEAPALRPFLARLTPESAVARRDVPGGTAPRRVPVAIAATRKKIARLAREITKG